MRMCMYTPGLMMNSRAAVSLRTRKMSAALHLQQQQHLHKHLHQHLHLHLRQPQAQLKLFCAWIGLLQKQRINGPSHAHCSGKVSSGLLSAHGRKQSMSTQPAYEDYDFDFEDQILRSGFQLAESEFEHTPPSVIEPLPPIEKRDCNELFKLQAQMETEVYESAVDNYVKMARNLSKVGAGTGMPKAQRMLVSWFEPLVKELETEIHRIQTQVPGPDRKIYGPCLLMVPPPKLAVITMHCVLDDVLMCGNAGTSLAAAARKIGEALLAEVNMLKLNKHEVARLTKNTKGSRIAKSINKKAQRSLAGDTWPDPVKVKVGMALVKIFTDTALLHNQPAFAHCAQTRGKRTTHRLWCSEEIVQELSLGPTDSTLPVCGSPAHEPMIIPPKPWVGVTEGGYVHLKTKAIRSDSKQQLRAVKAADMTVVFSALDALGKVPWRINDDVLHLMTTAYEQNLQIGALPSRQPLPLPNKSEFLNSDGTFDERKFRHAERKIKQKNCDIYSLNCDLKLKLKVASKFLGYEIYFPFNMDFRGRTYPVPPHLNHLGSDLSRSLLMFANPKPLGDHGFFWLKVHLANLFGVDKVPFSDRVAFVDKNWDNVIQCARNPLGENRWWTTADDPFQAYATCRELALADEHVYKEDYMCSLPVHMDGSCNGLQHYAALGRDEEGGACVNLLPRDCPQDVYKGVCNLVAEKIQTDATKYRRLSKEGKLDTLSSKERDDLDAAVTLEGKVDRKVVKQTVMTSVYGVTFIGARDQILARLKEKFPANDLTEEQELKLYKASHYVARLTMDAMGELFTQARSIMEWLGTVAKMMAKEGQPVSWMTPLGLPVYQPYRETRHHVVKTLLQAVTLTEHSDALPVSGPRQKSAFPPNFVHSLDSTHMLMTCLEMSRRSIDFSAVHDSYWALPADVDEMNEVLRTKFIELYSSPILESLRESIVRRFPELDIPPVPPRGNLDLNQVQKSVYFFA